MYGNYKYSVLKTTWKSEISPRAGLSIKNFRICVRPELNDNNHYMSFHFWPLR